MSKHHEVTLSPNALAKRLCGTVPPSSHGNQQTTVSMAATRPTAEKTAICRKPGNDANPKAR